MSYFLNEYLLYIVAAAGVGIGLAIGWFIRHRKCGATVEDMQLAHKKFKEEMQLKIDRAKFAFENQTKQVNSYKKLYRNLTAEIESKNGEIKLMTSRWQGLLAKAKELPKHQAWLKKVQGMYQITRTERNHFSNLANQNATMYADAVQKIKRLNERVTQQETYKFRLDDMIVKVGNLNTKVTIAENDKRGLYGMISQVQKKWRSDSTSVNHLRAVNDDMISKVRRLNEKVTCSENDIRGLYGMVSQVQSKWRQDRVDTIKLRELHPKMEDKTNRAQWKLAELDKKFTEKFQEQEAQNKTKLMELEAQQKSLLEKMQHRIDELTPLEGDEPGQNSKFNRFMDKIRLVGTSKNTVLGRTYKQIEQVKLQASEKERVYVDTCEEKDAIIDDLREQIRTAENRAQAACAAQVQESSAKINNLENEVKELNQSAALLREHEHTIEALKIKIKDMNVTLAAPKQTTKIASSSAKKEKSAAEEIKEEIKAKLDSTLSAPAKGLKIAAAKVKDELQMIKGIGPKMEKTLNEFGIHSFEQLANLAKDDIRILADKLGGFPGRIDRDKWISQSKKHFKKKYEN